MAKQEFKVGQRVKFSDLPRDTFNLRIVCCWDNPPDWWGDSKYFVKVSKREVREVLLKPTKTLGNRWHLGNYYGWPESNKEFEIAAIQTLKVG